MGEGEGGYARPVLLSALAGLKSVIGGRYGPDSHGQTCSPRRLAERWALKKLAAASPEGDKVGGARSAPVLQAVVPASDPARSQSVSVVRGSGGELDRPLPGPRRRRALQGVRRPRRCRALPP